MKGCLISLLLFICWSLPAQPTTLTIIGRHAYSQPQVGTSIIATFVDDPSRCDPERGYVPLADQIKHFKESLAAMGIDTHLFQPYGLIEAPFTTRKFKLTLTDEELVNKVLLTARRMIAKAETKPEYKTASLEDQYPMAVAALHDARKKADVYARHLGTKVDRIIYIDDDTRVASIFDESSPLSLDRLADLEDFLNNFGFLLFDSADGQSIYSLRVTFGLKGR